ncbi:MAG: outer membrane protein assembly factor BamA [Sorangiineae bacterium]|nr:outer membrane protein assembly factor BamA [Polyangiaceae bacterium]MEB2321253.1 outer membrane protein assembly factor BamA [Sorangiineae bacterium]
MLAALPAARRLPRWLALVASLLVALTGAAQPRADAPPAGDEPTAPAGPGSEHAQPLPATPPSAAEVPKSEAEKARGLPIVDIDVAGNRRVAKDDVLTYLRERVGQAFAPEALSEDVRELWNSGFFDDIEVDLEQREEGVALRFLVRERPNVSEVLFEGNGSIDTEDLSGGIESKTNTVLSYPAVRRSVQKIRDMYAEKGYFLAEVKSEVIARKNNEVAVRFKITEHSQVSVRRVTFIGNQHVSSDELREIMFTGNAGFFAFGSGGPFRQDAFERDIAMLSALYYDRGFLSVQIMTPRVMLTPDKNGIEITITIDEGPRYKIRQLRIFERGASGEEVEPIDGRRNLRNMVRARSGDYFNRAELLEDLEAVKTLYQDHGFANVDANPETRLNPETAEVDIVVPVARGPLVHFERIEVRGNSKTRDKVIRREMEIAEGDPFNKTLLEKSRRRITALGYFERVDIGTEEGSAPDRMNLYVEVTERPTGTFQVGAGFSSIENFIATAQVQQANLFGNGQSLSLQAQVSGLRQLVDVRFFEPYFLDSEFSMSVDLFDQLRIYNDFSQSSLGGALTFGYPLISPELVASVTYTAELDKVSTQTTSTFLGTSSAVSVFTRLPLANLFNDGVTSSVRPALTYDTRDNRLFPTSGIYLRGSSELASTVFASENEFLRHRFTGRFYYPLGAGFVAKLNTEAGVVTSPNSEGVPIFARFFLGGILDVRGYRFRTIGPRMPLTGTTDPNSAPILDGANIGGNLMYYQNLELEFPILDKVGIRGVFFTDAGNAWNLEQNYCSAAGGGATYAVTSPCFDFSSLEDLRTSWGFGLRWFSPLGPLRFEWGFPFKPLPYEESSVFEFTIGNFF